MKWFSNNIRSIVVAALLTLSQAVFVLEVGAQCPGPAQRTVLINLQRANVLGGTRAGQIPLTDTCGNQRYVRQVQINLDTINYIPTQTGNTANLSEFVFDTLGALWYIDWKGEAIQMAAGGTCDQDWLQIADASCPEAVTDSIYHQKYAAVGARYVWPGATFLVNDSSGVNGCLMVIQGERQNKLAFYDILNEQWTMLHSNNIDMSVYVPQDGSFTVTTATGTPDAATADIAHFQVNTLDSTVTLNQYPNTRRDTQEISNFLYTDDMGTVRSQSVDSLPYPDPVNIYTDDGTITEERYVNINTSTGGLLTFQTIFPFGAELTMVDTIFYTNVASGTNVSRWEIRPSQQEMSSYNGFKGAYVRTFQGPIVQLYAGRTANNEQILIDTTGVQIKTNNSFGTTGQVLRNLGGYLVWQDTSATTSVNIYNSNGTISTNRTVTLSDSVLWDIASANGAFQVEGLNGSAFRVSDVAITAESPGAALNLGSGTPVAMSLSLDAGTAEITDNRGTQAGLEYADDTYGPDFTDATLIHRAYAAQMISDSLATIPGGGDILQGGNSFGVGMVIGTNDLFPLTFETNGVSLASISTQGRWSCVDNTANTNTTDAIYTGSVNSTGTPSAGFGLRQLMNLESSTTNSQNAGAIDVIWSDATHATRTSDFVFSTVASGAALAELFRMGGTSYALTATASVSNTNTVADRFTIRTNSSGTAAANFGGGILFNGESTTTDNQDVGRITAYWTTATHATREGAIGFQLGDAGGAIAECVRIDRVSSPGTGSISIGTTNPLTISANAFSNNQSYTIGGGLNSITVGGSSGTVNIGGSTGSVNITNTGTNNLIIGNTVNAASSTAGVVIGNATFTQTSGTRDYVNFNSSFSPTSGTAVHNQFVFSGTFNQTGGANGITRNIYLNPTLTAVADFRGIEIAYSNSNAKGIYQTGANTTNNFVGGTMFGSTSAPSAVAAIEVSSTTKGILFPRMTTTQRDAITAVAGLAIFNTTTTKLEVYDGTTWQACW